MQEKPKNMWNKMRQIGRRFILVAAIMLVILVSFGGLTSERAIALISQQEEAPRQMLYQARHNLRDETGNIWKLVFYKRTKAGEIDSINLRLIGFPGSVEFSHPQPLTLITNNGKVIEAGDGFAEQSPGGNLGEYNFKKIVSELPKNEALSLQLPIKNQGRVEMKIPLAVILEWQAVLRRT